MEKLMLVNMFEKIFHVNFFLYFPMSVYYRVSQKTWEFSDEFDMSLLWISSEIPNFKSHNIIMSARVYFMTRAKDCKDVSIMSPHDEQ